MYSTGVDYSTLSISSLHRRDEDTVLLPSPPIGATSDMDKATVLLPSAPPGATPDREKAQTTTEGHGEEDRHDRPGIPCHHGAMLVVLTLSLAVGMAKGQLGHKQRQFTAYDCTSLQELRAVTMAEPPQCQDRLDQDPVSQRNQTYLLLQKATYRRQPVSRCKVLRTRVAHYCSDRPSDLYSPILHL
jgi:hypothetical protein